MQKLRIRKPFALKLHRPPRTLEFFKELDSSVWISLLVRDIHKNRADSIFKQLLEQEIIILVPMIVYAEVMNNIIKLRNRRFTNEVLEFFHTTDYVALIEYDRKFWYEDIIKCADFLKLRALDLLIVTTAILYKVDELHSFDRKMEIEYNKYRNTHPLA